MSLAPKNVTVSAERLVDLAKAEKARAQKAGEFRTEKLFEYIFNVAHTSACDDAWSETAMYFHEYAFKYFTAKSADRASLLKSLWATATALAREHHEGDAGYGEEGDDLISMVLEVISVEEGGGKEIKRIRVEEEEEE